MKKPDALQGLALKELAVSGLVLAAFAANAAAAPRERVVAQMQVDQVAITGGRLVITGRTAKPNQVIVLVNSGDKTASLPTRKFSFSLSYLPPTCKIDLQVEAEEVKDLVVAGCVAGAAPGRDGKDGKDGKEGKDGRDGMAYGSLPGDGTTFKCWPSDIVGLWFIRDYPSPNSRTIAHIAPDRVAGGNKLNVTEPRDPLKADKPESATQWAEFDQDKLYILNRDTKARAGLRGDIAADCRSVHWKGDGETTVRIWER
jgi:hypothetical protein